MEDPDASFVKRDDLVEVPAWDHSVSELGQLSSSNNTVSHGCPMVNDRAAKSFR